MSGITEQGLNSKPQKQDMFRKFEERSSQLDNTLYFQRPIQINTIIWSSGLPVGCDSMDPPQAKHFNLAKSGTFRRTRQMAELWKGGPL
jgi:hypothetical protein